MPDAKCQIESRHGAAKRRPALAPVVVALGVLLAPACRWAEPPALVRVHEMRPVMGTYMAITAYARDEATGQRAIAGAFARVEEVEQALSHYRERSDLSSLCRAAGGPPMPVSRDLCEALRRSIEVSAETDGAFDVTIGPLITLWKAAWKTHRLPTETAILAAQTVVDYRAIRLDPARLRAQLLRPGTRLDLGGIGKGYAVDQAVAFLRSQGITAALVALAGEIYALGTPPDREAWRIGIRDPNQPRGPLGEPTDMPILARPLLLRDRAVSTSGDYEQFGVIAGRRYSHIVDPRTGQPVPHMTSVSIVAPDSTTADAYATACSVLGPQAALAFVARHPGIEAMILHEKDGRLEALRSPGFGKLEDKKTNP
jgi:thiamine biosynthesis lipoprotein